MNIGIDLDGVLYDTTNYILTYAELFDMQIGGKGIINPNETKIFKRYGWSKENYNEFIQCLKRFDKEAPMMPFAKEVIEILQKDGHKLIAITARGSVVPEEVEITKKRLSDDKINFDKIYYNTPNKLEICKNENIDILIDDFYDTAEALSKEGITILYFRDLVLKFCDNPNVFEVHNWGEIYRTINSLKNKI